MTSLLPNVQPYNTAQTKVTATTQQTNQNYNVPQPTFQTPPYGRYATFNGFMSAILGGLFFAKPKHDVRELATLDNDTFQASTKKASKSMPTALQAFAQTREKINKNATENINFFFGQKETINTREILKKVKTNSLEELNAAIENLTLEIQDYKSLNLDEIFKTTTSSKALTKAQKTVIKECFGDDTLKTIQEKNIDDVKAFIIKKYETTNAELCRKKTAKILCENIIEEKVHKSLIQTQIKNLFLEENLNKLEQYYLEFAPKLSKRIFKTMAKWFAFGVGLSLAIDTISILFRRNKH